MKFWAVLMPQEDGKYLVRFEDIPEAITFGDDLDDAIISGLQCLLTVLEARKKDGKPIFQRIRASGDGASKPLPQGQIRHAPSE